MKIIKTYKFRLKPSQEHISMLKQHGGNSRFVWNKLLEYSNNYYKNNNKFPTQSQLQKYIICLKKEFEFIKISHSQPIQINALKLSRTIFKAFKKETINARNKKIAIAKVEKNEELRNKKIQKAMSFGFPKFKSKNKNNDNLFYPQGVKLGHSRIFFPKLGWINYIKHRNILGKQLFSTIVQDGNDYYVSITCELKQKDKKKVDINNANSVIGIDVGLKNFAVLSDNTVIENPRALKKNLKKLKKESKSLSNKEYNEETKVSSKNRIKQISKLQKIHRKVRNIRKDFLHKLSHHIITKYDVVILENLDIKEMQGKNGKVINRNISDVSWYEFGRMLEYKSVWNSKHFLKIDQYFPSTQLCNKCGNKMKISIEDRIYSCPNCKTVLDRDYNAALNIRNEGIRILKNIKDIKNTKDTVATTGIKALWTNCNSGWAEAGKSCG